MDFQTRNIWWINQGTTWETMHSDEDERYIWAPLLDKRGSSLLHWERLSQIQINDFILHYSDKHVRAIGVVIKEPEITQNPTELDRWSQDGRKVAVRAYRLSPPISIETFNRKILDLNIQGGPLNRTGGVIQGYAFNMTYEGLRVIQESSVNSSWPNFTLVHNSNLNNQNVGSGKMHLYKEKINNVRKFFSVIGFTYPSHWLENFYLSLKTKPFVILAGISGTGKTKLIELFASAIGAKPDERFKLIPVRPDWNDPSDLLGYRNLQGQFVKGPLTEFIEEASKPENRHLPFFVCLDEMNLARVEHYFSDLLSIMETTRWSDDVSLDDRQIVTNRLLVESALSIPDNLYIIGTVNMDETTHPFSKKVLDRAGTIEFNEISLDGWLEAFGDTESVLDEPDVDSTGETSTELGEIPNSFLRADYLRLIDLQQSPDFNEPLMRWATEQLVALNGVLAEAHLHIGYRVRDTILFYLTYNHRFQLLDSEWEALDFQVLQKILPRIQGSGQAVERMLKQLIEWAFDGVCKPKADRGKESQTTFADFQALYTGKGKTPKFPRSFNKLLEMLRRVEDDGYTSYWIV